MLSFITYVIGFILGFIVSHYVFGPVFFINKKNIKGEIDIDHETYLSRVQTYDNVELLNKNTKYILFKVNHDAKISREDHTL